jgi:cytochrome c oxidase cbb3-type subunit 3
VLYFGVDYYSSVTENQTSDQYTASPGKVVVKAAAGNVITENTVTLNTTAAVLDSGKAVFDLHCSVCHGDKGQGIVGPNLTDDYWLHGGKIGDIFKTISLGVGANGMPEWDKQLSNQQISDVTNFVESLHGTNPAGAKAAQGTK